MGLDKATDDLIGLIPVAASLDLVNKQADRLNENFNEPEDLGVQPFDNNDSKKSIFTRR